MLLRERRNRRKPRPTAWGKPNIRPLKGRKENGAPISLTNPRPFRLLHQESRATNHRQYSRRSPCLRRRNRRQSLRNIIEGRIRRRSHTSSHRTSAHFFAGASCRSNKDGSSKWMKTKQLSGFQWQNGYGGFSISPSHRAALEKYIAGQREHHRARTFEEEYRTLLMKYGIAFDERHVWD